MNSLKILLRNLLTSKKKIMNKDAWFLKAIENFVFRSAFWIFQLGGFLLFLHFYTTLYFLNSDDL